MPGPPLGPRCRTSAGPTGRNWPWPHKSRAWQHQETDGRRTVSAAPAALHINPGRGRERNG